MRQKALSAIAAAAMIMGQPAWGITFYTCKDCPASSNGYNDPFFNVRYVTDGTITLPKVVIYGNSLVDNYTYFTLYETPGAWTYLFLNGPSGTTSATQIETTNKLVDPTNVKSLCMLGRPDLARTVSTLDEVGRQDAIRVLVGLNQARWSTTLNRAYLNGTVVNLGGEVRISETFTFADGGRERWYINPNLSENAIPAPGTLQLGTGTPSGVPCGPKPTTYSSGGATGPYPKMTP
jgi:hypothetical protein